MKHCFLIDKDREKHDGTLRRDNLIMYIYTLEYHAGVIKISGKKLYWSDKISKILLNEKSRHRRRVYSACYHLKMSVYQFLFLYTQKVLWNRKKEMNNSGLEMKALVGIDQIHMC